jgi:hypothetical protein
MRLWEIERGEEKDLGLPFASFPPFIFSNLVEMMIRPMGSSIVCMILGTHIETHFRAHDLMRACLLHYTHVS